MFHVAITWNSRISFGQVGVLDYLVMLPVIEEEVKRFYSELNVEQPVVRNPFVHREEMTSRKKKLEVRKMACYHNFCRLTLFFLLAS